MQPDPHTPASRSAARAPAPSAASAASAPSLFSRRNLLKRAAAYAALPVVAGVYATQVEPFWPVFHEIGFPIRNLPRSFDGYRIAQITDMHAGETPLPYLRSVLDRVKQLQPDLLAVTGDLTHHDPAQVEPICRLLSTFNIPVLVSYGNHEYGIHRGDETACAELADLMQTTLKRFGLTLLRNSTAAIEHPDGPLVFAGLDDLWFGDYQPAATFANIRRDGPIIALSHNPDTSVELDPLQPDLILSGHTHGGQVRIPLLGPLYLNVFNRHHDQGLFHLKNSRLYVCRGIGYIHRIRFNCRPEIPIFRLERV
jgi:predicted MPP superfamily phosphohydrolase